MWTTCIAQRLSVVIQSRRGVTAAEYAILATAIVLVVAAAIVPLSDPVNGAFARLGTVITTAVNDLAASGAGTNAPSGSARAIPLGDPSTSFSVASSPEPFTTLVLAV